MEKLTVKNLGPIKYLPMETNRLTVLIGPQASGKSLLAQMLYFFKEFDAMLAARFPVDSSVAGWFENVLAEMLMSLRATHFRHYLGMDGVIEFASAGETIKLVQKNGGYWCDVLFDRTNRLLNCWEEDRRRLAAYESSGQLFIPTERSLYTRLSHNPVVLFSERMPYILSRFSMALDECGRAYDARNAFSAAPLSTVAAPDILDLLESKALKGNVHFKRSGMSKGDWFFLQDAGGETLLQFPVNAVSSGQMETWPFFAIANVYGMSDQPRTFYFEEPETHLHPKAQVEVVKTIAYLISRGHRFVITTHSPFILYVINNLIQAHMAYDGTPPEGEFSINPDHVAAYCLGDNPRSIVDEETHLLDLDEIDDVFDDIGEYFQSMLDKAYAKRKKNK